MTRDIVRLSLSNRVIVFMLFFVHRHIEIMMLVLVLVPRMQNPPGWACHVWVARTCFCDHSSARCSSEQDLSP